MTVIYRVTAIYRAVICRFDCIQQLSESLEQANSASQINSERYPGTKVVVLQSQFAVLLVT